MTEERIPPQSIEAEQAVLGAILIENEVMPFVLEIINEKDFYRETHKVIFNAMMSLYSKNEAIDMVTLTEVLRKEDKLEKADGIKYITFLAGVVPTAANVKYHSQIVYEKSVLRKLIRISTEIAAKAYDGSEEIKEQLDSAEKTILDIATRQNTNEYTMTEDMLMDVVNHFQMLAENKGNPVGIPTGFTDFDKLTSGLRPSDFIILAARPSMGKTSFALNLVQNVAIRGHKLRKREEPYVVAFFSLEMSKEQLMHRMVCAEAQIDSQRVMSGELSNLDWEKVWSTCDTLMKAKIAIDDTPAISVLEMRSKARKIKSEQGLDLIVVDYLQLMQGNTKRINEGRQQEVSDISRSLKALARELNVPIIALSQLSRSVESRQVKRPMLSDLRESGSLEQDADMVAFLYRDDYYNPETDRPNVTELIIAKHRNGPVDTIPLFFHKQFTKFVNLSRRED